MTIEEFNKLVALQQTIATEFQPLAQLINNKEEFNKIDHLQRDLILVQANQMNSLLGIIQIRLGLSANEVKEALAKEQAGKEQANTESKENEATKGTVETK